MKRHMIHECDHMRLVARDENGEWCHLSGDGYLGGICSAGVSVVEAITEGRHPLVHLVNQEPR